MPKPIGIYVRVSSQGDRADERFHSPKEQRDRASALVTARGMVPGPVFEDIDISGAMEPAKRPGMSALLAAIESGELGGVAAFSLDRLSREPSHGDDLVRAITAAGGVILTPDIPDALDTPTGEFTFGMLLQVARLYRRQAGARFATAKERSILAGIPVGRTPLGYRLGPERRLELDPDTAPLVRDVFERRAEGAGRTVLARLMGERTGALPTDHPHHRPHWSREAPIAIIRNRLYVTGRLTYGDIVSEWEAGGIVDEPLWQAAQRTGPDLRPPRGEGTEWLLSGFLKCAACGYNLSPSATNSGRRDGTKRRYYRCVNRRCTDRGSARAEALEAHVIETSFGLGDELETRTTTDDGMAALQEALDRAERRLTQVQDPEAMDALGDMWAPNVKARRAERDEAARALGEAREHAGAVHDLRLRDIWDDLDLEDRRAALRLYWKAIHVGRREKGRGTPLRFVARGTGHEAGLTVTDTTGGEP